MITKSVMVQYAAQIIMYPQIRFSLVIKMVLQKQEQHFAAKLLEAMICNPDEIIYQSTIRADLTLVRTSLRIGKFYANT